MSRIGLTLTLALGLFPARRGIHYEGVVVDVDIAGCVDVEDGSLPVRAATSSDAIACHSVCGVHIGGSVPAAAIASGIGPTLV